MTSLTRSHAAWLSLLALSAATALGCSASSDEGASGANHAVTGDTCAKEWSADVAYRTDARVSFGGKIYRCVQGHTSLSVWPPDVVPALWQPVDEPACSGNPSTPPPSNPPPPPPPVTNPPPSNPPPVTNPPPANPPPVGNGATEYAPYFYTWGWGNPAYPFTGLTDLQAKAGLRGVTLAFVLADGGQCAVTQDIVQHKGDVDAFRAAGGRVKASFGGANGTYIEGACKTDAALAGAISDFVTRTGITDLDFDVEQAGYMDADTNARRARALKTVQAQKGIKVAFTLAAMPRDKWQTPGGVTAASLEVIKSAVAAGVSISHVNLMTMDYGSYYSGGRTMADCAESALTDANAQLRAAIPGLSEAAAWGMLGVTPMIGQNDVAGEIFTLADAQHVAGFARDKKVGLVSFWAINRDQACAQNDLALCSKVNTGTFQFHDILKTVQ